MDPGRRGCRTIPKKRGLSAKDKNVVRTYCQGQENSEPVWRPYAARLPGYALMRQMCRICWEESEEEVRIEDCFLTGFG